MKVLISPELLASIDELGRLGKAIKKEAHNIHLFACGRVKKGKISYDYVDCKEKK